MTKRNLKRKVAQQCKISNKTNSRIKQKVVYEESSSESEEEFEVEKILAKRIDGSKIKYLLKWKHFPESENSWADKDNLNCSSLIKEFEDNLKRRCVDNTQKTRNENKKEKNDVDVPVKRNLRSSKTSHSTHNSQKCSESSDDFVIIADTRAKHITKNVKSNKTDTARKAHNDSLARRAVKCVESNKQEISKKKQSDSRSKEIVKKAESNEIKKLKKDYGDSREKLVRTKHAELNKHEIDQKTFIIDSKEKPARIKNPGLNEHEIVKKRHNNDSKEKPARIKNIGPSDHEIVKKHIDFKEKPARIQNTGLNEYEIVKKRHYIDSEVKHAVKNVEINKHERTNMRKRHNDSEVKHAVKNVELNKHEITKKGHSGLSQRKPEAVQSSSRRRKVPKIQNLQYYVKSTSFPTKRKKGVFSVMRVSFQGTDVLKGLEHFVEAGIAPGLLPDFLYDKPVKTGATEFEFTI